MNLLGSFILAGNDWETAVANTELQAGVASLRQLLLLVGGIGLALIGVVVVCTLLVLRAVRRKR